VAAHAGEALVVHSMHPPRSSGTRLIGLPAPTPASRFQPFPCQGIDAAKKIQRDTQQQEKAPATAAVAASGRFTAWASSSRPPRPAMVGAPEMPPPCQNAPTKIAVYPTVFAQLRTFFLFASHWKGRSTRPGGGHKRSSHYFGWNGGALN